MIELIFSILFTPSISFSQPEALARCDVRVLLAREGIAIPFRPQKRAARTPSQMQDLFEKTRSLLLAEVTHNQSMDLTPEQRLMVRRLKSIELQVVPCSTQSTSTNPGASYSLLDNRIKICDHTSTASDITLISVLGHELGHSIDIVNLGCRTFRISQPGFRLEDTVPQDERIVTSGKSVVLKKGSGPKNPFTKPLNLRAFRTKLKIISDGGRTFNECEFPENEGRKRLRKLLESGVIEVVDEGNEIVHHPQLPAWACLHKYSNWPRPPTDQSSAEIGGYAEFGERSAQIWGAKAVAAYVREQNNIATKEILSLVQFVPLPKAQKSEKEIQLNELYFDDPALQKSLGCRQTRPISCLQTSPTSQGEATSNSKFPPNESQR